MNLELLRGVTIGVVLALLLVACVQAAGERRRRAELLEELLGRVEELERAPVAPERIRP